MYMHFARKTGIIGLTLLAIVPLCSCGGGAGSTGLATPTLTLWQLPPEFTQTAPPTMTFTPSPRVSPTPTVPELQSAAAVPLAAGWKHTCAIASEGGVMCWGENENGQLGDGSRTDRNRPVDVMNIDVAAAAVAAGSAHSCILTEEGGVKCWGRNLEGQLGDGTAERSSEPVNVAGLESGVAAIAAGDYHTCALMETGSVMCWGLNESGQLGDGTFDSRSTPVEVQLGEAVATGVTAGTAHSCASTTSGEVLCWGSNQYGQLGDGSEDPSRAVPSAVTGFSEGFTVLSGKGDRTCVQGVDGMLYCWGQNKYGELGDGTHDMQPIPVLDSVVAEPVKVFGIGWSHTCGVMTDDTLFCWGWNFYGQLGEGSTANRREPDQVQGLEGIPMYVVGGGGHTCAILEDASVDCWGWNESGQLGNYTNDDSLLPAKVFSLTAMLPD
jgi:alpha-tubulin suppressor-like RCC1 family protein